MKNLVLTIYIYAVTFLLGTLLIPVMAVLALLTRKDPTRRKTGWLMHHYGHLLFRMMPIWAQKTEGKPPEDINEKGYVVIANHQTTGDIFLLTNVPWEMRWVSKVELMKYVPILGVLLWLSGDIPVRRGNKQSVVNMMAQCRQTLSAGMNVMIFPEGTRMKANQLGPFKDGAFHLAIETQRPILPLAISGTTQMWPKNTLCLGASDAVIRILDPIPTAGLTQDDLPQLKAKARQAMLEVLVKSGDKIPDSQAEEEKQTETTSESPSESEEKPTANTEA